MKKWQRKVIYFLFPIGVFLLSVVITISLTSIPNPKSDSILHRIWPIVLLFLYALLALLLVMLFVYWSKKEPKCKVSIYYLIMGLMSLYLPLIPMKLIICSIFHVSRNTQRTVSEYMSYASWFLFILLVIYQQVWLRIRLEKKEREEWAARQKETNSIS